MLGGGNQGQTSLTGKNPFAILKASAIASTSSAVFPNNFTNLPKVSPPFLDALESGEEGNVYTLVLDLDETLIHNVEVCNPNPSVYFTRSLFFSTFTAFNTARLAISISALVDLNFAAHCLIFTGWSFQKSWNENLSNGMHSIIVSCHNQPSCSCLWAPIFFIHSQRTCSRCSSYLSMRLWSDKILLFFHFWPVVTDILQLKPKTKHLDVLRMSNVKE